MIYVHIIYFESIDKYHVGQTVDLESKVLEHNSGFYSGPFTTRATDWKLYLNFACAGRKQALCIERHIKRMKTGCTLKVFRDFREKLIG
jgi:putative endonuclease